MDIIESWLQTLLLFKTVIYCKVLVNKKCSAQIIVVLSSDSISGVVTRPKMIITVPSMAT